MGEEFVGRVMGVEIRVRGRFGDGGEGRDRRVRFVRRGVVELDLRGRLLGRWEDGG